MVYIKKKNDKAKYMVFHPLTHELVTPGRLYIENGVCLEDVNGKWKERKYDIR